MNTCCFTGHRSYKLGLNAHGLSILREKLKIAIEDKISNGVDVFYTGMAEGVDLMAADIVLELRRYHKNLQLIAVVPFLGQEKNWRDSLKKDYSRIRNCCNEVYFLSPRYYSNCYFVRDEYMVDRSDCVIAVYNGKGGGTKYTINYALSRGKQVTCIKPGIMEIMELTPKDL